jgi:hypothetical protein
MRRRWCRLTVPAGQEKAREARASQVVSYVGGSESTARWSGHPGSWPVVSAPFNRMATWRWTVHIVVR